MKHDGHSIVYELTQRATNTSKSLIFGRILGAFIIEILFNITRNSSKNMSYFWQFHGIIIRDFN